MHRPLGTAPPLALALAFGVVVAGPLACVPVAKYDTLAETSSAQRRTDEQKIGKLQKDLEVAAAATQARDAKLADLDATRHNVQAALDEATAMNAQLRAELGRLGHDVDAILKERGSLAKALEEAKLRLDELRRAQAAAEARAALFRDLASRFRAPVDAGQIRIEPRRGRLSMLVRESLLFAPQHGEIATAGDRMLEDLARAISASAPPGSGRRFVVNAHVDDPPKSKRAGASYELGAQRSIAVVERLVRLGVSPTQLIASTSGAFDPVTTTPESDARLGKNVLEISLQPSAEDVVSVLETK